MAATWSQIQEVAIPNNLFLSEFSKFSENIEGKLEHLTNSSVEDLNLHSLVTGFLFSNFLIETKFLKIFLRSNKKIKN